MIGGSETKVNTLKTSYASEGWTIIDVNLNEGVKGSDFVFLIYKKGSRANTYKGFVTDLYLNAETGSHPDGSQTKTITYGNHTYDRAPYDGDSDFYTYSGHLNAKAGGMNIHLYYTKENFSDKNSSDNKRVLSSITCNDKSYNDGNDKVLYWWNDLSNDPANVNIGNNGRAIYIHVTTATMKNRPLSDPIMATGLVYNGQPQKLIKTAATISSGTMFYKVGSGSYTWHSSDVTATEAGNHTVSYYAGANDYGDASDVLSKPVTIAKSPNSSATVSFSSQQDIDNISPIVSYNLSKGAITYKYATSKNGTYNVSTPSAGGTYWIKATIGSDANTYEFTTAACEVRVIAPIEKSTINAIPDQTYTGGTLTPQVSVSYNGTALVKDVDYTLSYSNNKNVGTATVTITGKGYYKGSISKTFKIVPKEISIAWGEQTLFIYNGTEQAPTATAEGLVNGDECTITISGAAKGVGTYTATATALSNANYKLPTENLEKTFEITPKEITIAWGEQTTFAYDGAEHIPTAAIEGLLDGDNCELTVTGAQKNVGSYTATVTELSNDNYKLPTTGLEQNFEITKATLTVTAKNKTIAYGDEPANDGVEYSSFLGSDDASVLGGTLTYGYNYEKGNKTGEYVITPSGLTADNYEINFVSGTLTVEPKEITVAWGEQTSFIYNGTEQAPTATAEGLVNDDDCSITVSGAAKEVGTYTATATVVCNDNYKLPTENLEVQFEITPKEISVSWDQTSLVYNGTEQAPTATAEGLVNDDDCSITVSGAAKEVGTYTASATVMCNDNYKLPIENFEVQFEIFAGINLASLTSDLVVQDGYVLGGTLDGSKQPYKISIADGATVTLKGVTINGVHDARYKWAGITCEGDCHIILAGTNVVKGFYNDYPGIYVPIEKTLIISGTGSLEASSNGDGAGIGGGYYVSCGNIEISDGTITATGGGNAAGIGGGYSGNVGNIMISGGSVTATGGHSGAGIGGGYRGNVGNILISGGSVNATGGISAAGIGGGNIGNVGKITISGDETKVTATKGTYAPYSVGKGRDGSRTGKITIGDVETSGINMDTFEYPYLMLVYKDGEGKNRAVLNGEYNGTDAVAIDKDIAVESVTFNREFSVNLENGGFSTIMLPFDIKAENLTGVKSIFKFDDVKTDKNGKNAVGVNYVWCNATIGEEEEKKHPDRNCNKYSGELKAYTPYMVEMETPTLGIKGNVTLKSSNNATNSVVSESNWVFRGALQKKEWSKEDEDIKNGQIWAFAGSARNGASIGKFVQFGGNNWVNPFRAYLVDCTTYPDASECKDETQPEPSFVSRYRFADVLAPATSAENSLSAKTPMGVAASETASIESMDIVIVYGDSASGERPTVIGRMNPATGEIRMLPRTKQTYDLKGRRIGNGKKAKGAYYKK